MSAVHTASSRVCRFILLVLAVCRGIPLYSSISVFDIADTRRTHTILGFMYCCGSCQSYNTSISATVAAHAASASSVLSLLNTPKTPEYTRENGVYREHLRVASVVSSTVFRRNHAQMRAPRSGSWSQFLSGGGSLEALRTLAACQDSILLVLAVFRDYYERSITTGCTPKVVRGSMLRVLRVLGVVWVDTVGTVAILKTRSTKC